MTDLTLTVNKINYRIACEAGQEGRVRTLAKKLDEKVTQLIRTIGNVGEQQLLMMAGLMLADETEDLTNRLRQAGTATVGGAAPASAIPGSAPAGAPNPAREAEIRAEVMAAAENELAAALNDIAERVESLAVTVEKQIAAMP